MYWVKNKSFGVTQFPLAKNHWNYSRQLMGLSLKVWHFTQTRIKRACQSLADSQFLSVTCILTNVGETLQTIDAYTSIMHRHGHGVSDMTTLQYLDNRTKLHVFFKGQKRKCRLSENTEFRGSCHSLHQGKSVIEHEISTDKLELDSEGSQHNI